MRYHSLLLLGTAVVTSLSAALLSYGTGALPGTTGSLGTVPGDVTRRLPACGACHRAFPGGNFLEVSIDPSLRSLDLGQSISITTSATGGRPHSQDWGGFVTEVSAGGLSPGSNSQIDASGRFVTHRRAFQSNQRSWSYGYSAPNTAGLVEIWAVVNTVDGDGRAGGGDLWAFHGSNQLAIEATPARLYVNAAGVTNLGESCVGSFRNVPVLGSAQPPIRGNQNFAVELHGATVSAPVTFLFGVARAVPFDLSALGVSGCSLYVDSFASQAAVTSSGRREFGEGRATAPVPIPNDPGLIGAVLSAQAVIVDVDSGRGIPVALTNALTITIR